MNIDLQLNQSERLALSLFIATHQTGNWDPKFGPMVKTHDDAIAMIQGIEPPRNAIEQMNAVLNAVGELAPNFGQRTHAYNDFEWATFSMSVDPSVMQTVFRELMRLSYLNVESLQTNSGLKYTASLTAEGWERIGNTKKDTASKTAFVAMWFDKELDPIWNDAFKPVLSDLGWKPERIDKEHFTNRIDDEILRRINNCGLLIADFTGARHGVYFEAGYALGQGKPVIWTCNESWRTKMQTEYIPNGTNDPSIKEQGWMDTLHFDTKTYPHLTWSDAADLKQKLEDRLSALGLDLRGK